MSSIYSTGTLVFQNPLSKDDYDRLWKTFGNHCVICGQEANLIDCDWDVGPDIEDMLRSAGSNPIVEVDISCEGNGEWRYRLNDEKTGLVPMTPSEAILYDSPASELIEKAQEKGGSVWLAFEAGKIGIAVSMQDAVNMSSPTASVTELPFGKMHEAGLKCPARDHTRHEQLLNALVRFVGEEYERTCGDSEHLREQLIHAGVTRENSLGFLDWIFDTEKENKNEV